MNRVAVVNRSNFKNYGSVLQCYALCESIRALGWESELVWVSGNLSKNYDFRLNKIVSSLWKLMTHPSLWRSTANNVSDMNARVITEETVRRFEAFTEKHITERLYTNRALKRAARRDYAKVVCGSDQIWCSTTLYPDPLMYLRFAPQGKRIAYAPSLGRDYIPDHNKRKMRRYISEIPSLSVRETEGQRLIRELTGREAFLACDPTFLLDKEHYKRMQIPVENADGALVCYFLDVPSEGMQKKIAAYAAERDLPIVSLGCRLAAAEALYPRVLRPDAGPGEFLYLVEHAEQILTDSYHGMLFSITFEKKFLSVERAYAEYDQSSRQKTVLSLFGLSDLYVTDEDALLDTSIDYAVVTAKKNEFAARSLAFLRESLAAEETDEKA